MASPIKILHVVVNMNRGGAETLLMNLYRNIDRSKVQFDFLTCRKGVFDSEIEEMGGKIHLIPYITEVGHKGYIKALNKFFLSNSNYNIVHSHMDKMSGFVLRAAKEAGVKVRIAHSHSIKSEGGIVKRLYKWYAGLFILTSSTKLFACSNKAAKWLFGSSSEYSVVKNGVDLEKFSPRNDIRVQVRKELGIKENTLVIGHVGRFSYPKNHSFLLEIFKEILCDNLDSKLILVGDGPLRNQIEQKANNFNLNEHVRFLGVKDNVHELLQGIDLFVFPSIYEGFPVTLVEAQALGLPCLVSNKVTTEVDLGTGLISFMDLGNAKIWAKQHKNKKKLSDNNYYKKILRENGFDILNVAKNLENYYIKSYEDFRLEG